MMVLLWQIHSVVFLTHLPARPWPLTFQHQAFLSSESCTGGAFVLCHCSENCCRCLRVCRNLQRSNVSGELTRSLCFVSLSPLSVTLGENSTAEATTTNVNVLRSHILNQEQQSSNRASAGAVYQLFPSTSHWPVELVSEACLTQVSVMQVDSNLAELISPRSHTLPVQRCLAWSCCTATRLSIKPQNTTTKTKTVVSVCVKVRERVFTVTGVTTLP